jgi:hypothetical protein
MNMFGDNCSLILLRKMLLSKKSMRKVSCPRARFNDKLELSGWPGKDGTELTLG